MTALGRLGFALVRVVAVIVVVLALALGVVGVGALLMRAFG